MRLSTKGRYAVMAMVDLARQGGGRAVSLAEIAERQDISLSYLEQLFAKLRRKGLVQSARGPGGGYRLARSAEDTAISDIVVAVDEPLKVVRCVSAMQGCLPGGARCATHDLWEALGRQIHQFLSSTSLADGAEGRLAQPAAVQAA